MSFARWVGFGVGRWCPGAGGCSGQVPGLGGEREVEDVLGAWVCRELGTAGRLQEDFLKAVVELHLAPLESQEAQSDGWRWLLEKIRVVEKPRREHKKKSTWSLSMLVLSTSTSSGQHLLLASCNGTWGEASVPTIWWGSGAGCSPRDATSCLAAAAWGPRHLHP